MLYHPVRWLLGWEGISWPVPSQWSPQSKQLSSCSLEAWGLKRLRKRAESTDVMRHILPYIFALQELLAISLKYLESRLPWQFKIFWCEQSRTSWPVFPHGFYHMLYYVQSLSELGNIVLQEKKSRLEAIKTIQIFHKSSLCSIALCQEINVILFESEWLWMFPSPPSPPFSLILSKNYVMNKNVLILSNQNISITFFFPKYSVHENELEEF